MTTQPLSRPRALSGKTRLPAALSLSLLALALLSSGRAPGASADSRPAREGRAAKPSLSDEYGKLPLAFEENRGQTDRRVRFVSRGDGYALFLTGSEAVLRLRGGCARRDGEARTVGDSVALINHEGDADGNLPCASGEEEAAVLRLGLAGARRGVRVSGADRLAGESNYFVGASRGWRTRVPQFARVVYEGVYPGVDLVYYGNQRRLEYDFQVAPGADPRRIALKFDGAESARVDERGDLVLSVAGREVIQRKPVAYQELGGERREVAARYVLADSPKRGRGTPGTFKVGFELGAYDRARPLVIDPVLVYSTYVGGTGFEEGVAVAVDAAGSAYLTGNTGSLDFPVVGGVQLAGDEFSDAFVLKLNPAGTSIVYATYLGGTRDEAGNGLAVDSQGSAYVAGFTASENFPVTPGAAQTSLGGGFGDGFLTKLNPAGTSIVYSTYVGGNGSDIVNSVAVDAAGSAYFVGRTESTVFGMAGVPPVVRGGHTVYKSADAAANWGGSANGLAATSVSALAADPSNANALYAGAPGGVFKTTDGGASWTLTGQARPGTAPANVLSLAVDPNNPNVVYAATLAGGLLFKSADGGNLYDVKNTGINAAGVNTLIAVPTGQGATTLYAGTNNAGVFKSTDNAEMWTPVSVGLPASGAVNELVYDPSNPNVLYAGTNNAGVFRTTNGGAFWSAVTGGLPPSARITGLALDPASPLTLYAAISSSFDVVYKTTDGGGSWSARSNGLTIPAGLGQFIFPAVNALSISPAAPATVYAAATNGGVFKTTDGGANWALANTGMQNTAALSVLAHPASASTVLAGFNIGGDAFAGKLNAAGSQPVYFRHLAGSDNDTAGAVAVDAGGNAYLVGTTASSDFPVANAFRPAKNSVASDAFLTKLSPDGQTLVYSTYLGGSAADSGRSVAVNAQGQAHVTGQTFSNDFPFVTPVDSNPIFNSDAFVTKFNAGGSALLFSTFLGGDGPEQGTGIAVDARDIIYVTGNTSGGLFLNNPTQATYGGGSSDAFLARYDLGAGQLDFVTYLGGASSDTANDIAVDAAGGVYVVGTTSSGNFPTANPVRPALGGEQDAFVSKFAVNADLSITMRDSRDPVKASSDMTYTLVVTNHGPDVASNVRVADKLPLGLTFISATPTAGTCSGTATVNCDLGQIASGDSEAVVILVIAPPAVGTLSNTASVTSDTPDLDLSDNTATEQTRISDQPSVAGRVTTVTTGQFGGQTIPLAGVTITLTGGHPDLPPHTQTTVTDAEGRYQFADLTMIGHYSVTPSRQGFVFNPGLQFFSHLTTDVTADFVAVGCSFTITPSNQSFDAGGGAGTINVNASDPRCPRTATSNAPWITLTSGAAGNGGGAVGFTVAATNGSRSGTINVAGNLFTVWQEFSSCGEASFVNAPFISSSTPGFATLDADFNNDNKPDLTIADISGLNGRIATVLLNEGGGRFRASSTVGVSSVFLALAAGDFNGDGNRDIVTLRRLDENVSGFVTLRLGDGAGNFSFKTTEVFIPQLMASPAAALAAGDFNGDGKTDLAVARAEAGAVTVLLGHATDGFSPPTQVGAQNSMPTARLVVTSDFDKDGKADLAVVGAAGVYFLRGDGAGGFNVPTTFSPTGVFEHAAVAAGDVNGDGNTDLAVAGDDLDVLFGDGAGGFAAPLTLSPKHFSISVVIRDFNGDGRGDVAAAGGGGIQVFTAAPADAFAPAEGYTTGVLPFALAANDFDGDGRQDLVSTDSPAATAAGVASYLLRGDGAGNFPAARVYAAPSNPFDTAPVDFNGDGKLDLLVLARRTASYLPAAGAPGEFGASVVITTLDENINFRLPFSTADFNRDGRPDFAFHTSATGGGDNRARVFLNDGAGAFAPASDTALEGFGSVLFDDFNGDGNPDLTSVATFAPPIFFRPGNGAGGFGAPVAVPHELPRIARLAAGDFDGDGKLDLAAGLTTGGCEASRPVGLAVLRGDGAGGFSAPTLSEFTGGFLVHFLARDLNADGRSDLVVADCFRSLRILFARGDGTFNVGGAFGFIPPNANPQRFAFGDLNGDGKLDLVVADGDGPSNVNKITVLRGDGTGTFFNSATIFAGIASAGVSVGDLDGNGRDDVAFASITANHVGVLLNSCPVPAATSVQFSAATFAATEGTDRSVLVTVTRTGDTTGEATVGYATSDGTANERRDYTAARGRLRFAAGEQAKTFEVVITDDRLQEPAETFGLSLSEPTGAALGTQAAAVVTVNSDDAANGPSPVKDASFDTEFFVRQHYADFLNRVPEAGGLAFWVGGIESCGADQQCREVKKVDTSAAFFLSIEFQETGFLAVRTHKAAFGNLAGRPVPVRLHDFLSDSRQIGDGVVVGTPGWPAQLEANKAAYFNAFAARPFFTALYPQTMTAAEFVDTLFTRAGVQPTQAERQAAVNAFGAGGNTGRAAALRSVAESQTLKTAETNKAFVLMQYFGYLRRNPDDPQDTNFDGFFFWLTKLEQFDGNYVAAEMVKAFIQSIEYGDRFGL